MATIAITWDPTAPAGGDNIKDGDDSIRVFKTGLVERLRNGGHRMQTAGATTDVRDGLHCCGEKYAFETATTTTAGATPAGLLGEFYIYANDGATPVLTIRDSTAATPSELFAGALKVRTTGNVTAATGTFSGAVSTGALTATGHIKPATDNLYDLGDVTHRIKNAWFSGTVVFSGAVTHSAVETFAAGVDIQGNGTSPAFLLIETSQYSELTTILTAGTTTLSASARLVICDLVNVGGNVTINLPAAASSSGRELWFSIYGSGAGALFMDLNPNGSELIDNSSTSFRMLHATAGQVDGVHIVCNGTAWIILAHHRVY